MADLRGVLRSLGPGRSLPERVALFAAAAAVGPSFEPGLQPRRTVDQAIATGVISASTLSLVTATQGFIHGASRAIVRTEREDTSGSLLLAIGGNAAAALIGEGIARALPPRDDEPARRGLARTAAQRFSRVALAGAAISAVVGSVDLIVRRTPRLAWLEDVPLALPAGIAASAFEIRRVQRRAAAVGDDTIAGVSIGNSVGISFAVGAGVVALQAGERAIAEGVSRGIARIAPRYDVVSNPIGHLVSLAVMGGVLVSGYEYVVRRVEQGSAAIEPAYHLPPASPYVSGGPSSAVAFDSLSREGRRFTNMVLTRAEIGEVMGTPATHDPIRLFVGLESAAEVEDRVDLLMDEMVRTGAFDRDVIVFASPTGSGYINYVLAEAVEYLTLGNSAIATMQYSMLPSPMSLRRTGLAIEQNRAFMHAITGYMRGMDPATRPKLLVFGESLGALTMQDIWRHRTAEAMERDFIHGSIYLGTPSATEFAKSWRLDPDRVDPKGHVIEVDSFGEYLDLPEARRQAARHILITHFDDPIPKFGTNLLMRQPAWLGPVDQRPPRVPRSSRWRPGTTFVLTGLDMVNAMDVVPGRFGRRGHDYREDIARFVSTAYGLPATPQQMEAMEQALRTRELRWAEQRVVYEQLARAREALIREMKSWDVSSGAVDDVVASVLRQSASAPG